MIFRMATGDDCSLLAGWNQQLIQDEGHRNSMSVAELEARMRAWLASGEYQAVIFAEAGEAVAYALFHETSTEIHLRQFFVVRARRRAGLGRRAMQQLFSECWSREKRLTVDVLTGNLRAVAFWRAMGYQDYGLSLEIMPGARTAPPE